MNILENVSLASYTTFKIGGPARYFVIVKTEDELKEAIDFAEQNKLAIFILGGGSNLLVSDSGFSGLVIKIELNNLKQEKINDDIVRVTAGAGISWDDLVEYSVSNGLYGIENLSAIPGTVGASPVQNIGAYGVEAKDIVAFVKVFDINTKKFKNLSKIECMFGYRDSIFKKPEGSKFIVTEVSFDLKKNGKINKAYKDVEEYFVKHNLTNPSLFDIRKAISEIRASKLPDWHKYGTAGSFFKNVVLPKEQFLELQKRYPEIPAFPADSNNTKVPTAWILDNICHLKGYKIDNVGLYEKHSLVFVNYGNGRADQIIALMNFVISKVKDVTGITLEPEVVLLG